MTSQPGPNLNSLRLLDIGNLSPVLYYYYVYVLCPMSYVPCHALCRVKELQLQPDKLRHSSRISGSHQTRLRVYTAPYMSRAQTRFSNLCCSLPGHYQAASELSKLLNLQPQKIGTTAASTASWLRAAITASSCR